MMLLILDKRPYEASYAIPKEYKHKQLLELMQMISCVVDFGYKQIPQGKEIKEWIKKNMDWVACFAKVLYQQIEPSLTEETQVKYKALMSLLYIKSGKPNIIPFLKTGVFRYNKEYEELAVYDTNTELPIDICVKAYKDYLNWKLENKEKKE